MNRSLKIMALVVVAALAMTERSQSAVNTITYNFSGTCQDCSGTATATLTVVGTYALGTALSSSNVVSFTYNGTNLLSPFTMTPSSPNFYVSGSIANYPGTNNVTIQTTQSNSSNFFSSTNGSWAVGNLSDFGSVSIWGTPVPPTPAPSAGILLALGLVMLTGFALWRRRQTA